MKKKTYIQFYKETMAWWRKHHPQSSLPRDHVVEYWYDEYLDSIEKEMKLKKFLEKKYKHERYGGRGEDYVTDVLESHKKSFSDCGCSVISKHDSVTGEVIFFTEMDVAQ